MDWIQTFTGRKFYPVAPRAADVAIEDIAHALSLLCRFNGHCAAFYSVAEHSVRVAAALPRELRLWGLLHDAAEAYLGDVPRPLKRNLTAFTTAEERLLEVIAARYRLAWPMPAAVALADDRLLATEARDLMAPPPEPWGLTAEPLPDRIAPWGPAEAEARFLEAFAELT